MTRHRSRALCAICLLTLAIPLAAPAQIITPDNRATAREKSLARTLSSRFARVRADLDWTDRTVAEALKELGRFGRVTIIPDRLVADRLEDPVNMKLQRVNLRSAMKLLGENHGLVLQLRRGVVFATTQEEAWKRAMSLEIHSVRMMLYEPPDFPAPDIGIRPGGVEPGGNRPEPELKEGKDPELLLRLLRQGTGGTDVWDVDGAQLEIVKGKLIVRHAPEVRRQLRTLLNRLRRTF